MTKIKMVRRNPEYRVYRDGKFIMFMKGGSQFSFKDIEYFAEKIKKENSGAQVEIVKYQVVAKVIL